MKATFVIPQKTNSPMTLELVRQLHQHEPGAEVIVIHDTPDDEMEELPCCRLIRNPRPGVTAAWNHGINEAENEHVVVLNNDVICAGPFLNLLTFPSHVLVGARWRKESMIGTAAQSLPGGADSLWLEGWFFSMQKSYWRRVGGFDESMKLYFSDLDFQVRGAMLKLDRATVDDLPLQHLGHRTTRGTPGVREQWHIDREVFVRKLGAAAV